MSDSCPLCISSRKQAEAERLPLEPVAEYCESCDGSGWVDPDTRCSKCHVCGYCGNASLEPLAGRDEEGDPVHPACGPVGAFRVEVERRWAARPMVERGNA